LQALSNSVKQHSEDNVMSRSIFINRFNADQGVLTVNGRTYRVELKIAPDDSAATRMGNQCRYILRGARGAEYHTFRTQKYPTQMFLVNGAGKVTSHALAGVWLTDNNGELKVL
jgi:hypothetical protein